MKVFQMILSVVFIGLASSAILTGCLLFPEYLHTKNHLMLFLSFLGIGLGCGIFIYYTSISKTWIVYDNSMYRNEVSVEGKEAVSYLYMGVLFVGVLFACFSLASYYVKPVSKHTIIEHTNETESEPDDRFNSIIQGLKPSEG